MKNQYGWIKYSMCYLLYIIITIVLLCIADFSLKKKKIHHLYQNAIQEVYPVSTYAIQYLSDSEDFISYVRVLDKQQNTVGYVSLIQDCSYFHLFKGWIAFNPSFDVIDFKIDTLDDFPILKHLMNTVSHTFFLQSLQVGAPFLVNQPAQNLVDDSGNNYPLTGEETQSLLFIEEKFNLVALSLKSKYMTGSHLFSEVDTNNMRVLL